MKQDELCQEHSFHCFIPQNVNTIAFKTVSFNTDFSGEFTFQKNLTEKVHIEVKMMDFVACTYDSKWWIGLVLEVNTNEQDFRIKFLHPSGPSKSFYWPPHEDICWVPSTNYISHVRTLSTTTGRTYKVDDNEYGYITSLFRHIYLI